MRTLLTLFLPSLILLLLISIAGVLGYWIVAIIGDAIPLRKIISKTTLILLVLSIYPSMAWLQLKKQDIGVTRKKIFCKQLIKGLLLGILILTPIIISLLLLDLWHYDQTKIWTLTNILIKVIGVLLIALLVAIPEEFIFRGILLTGLRKKLSVFWAIAGSTFYYASLHFLKSDIGISTQELSLISSYIIITDAFNNLLQLSNLPAFIALLVVGVFLACVRLLLPQSMALCIGIHAGWVFLIKITSAFFDKNKSSQLTFLVSDYDGIIGHLVSVWLILFTVFFLVVTTRHNSTINKFFKQHFL